MTPFCGCLGCRNPATTRISYDGREMVVCDSHARDQQASITEVLG
jgi:hypothetical protein